MIRAPLSRFLLELWPLRLPRDEDPKSVAEVPRGRQVEEKSRDGKRKPGPMSRSSLLTPFDDGESVNKTERDFSHPFLTFFSFFLVEEIQQRRMWLPRGLAAALLIAVLAVVIAGGGGMRKWSFGGGGGLKFFPTSTSRRMPHPPHCSLLEATRRHDFVIAAERVVLPDGVYPAASECSHWFVSFLTSSFRKRLFFFGLIDGRRFFSTSTLS